MWTQIVGKIRLALAPAQNHFWHSALYVTTRGLTTTPMPHGERSVAIDFDFLAHRLRITVDDGEVRELALAPRSVADFYAELMALLASLDLEVRIWPRPVESETTTPFMDDHAHADYDPELVQRFFHVLLRSAHVLQAARGGFVGKSSPVHFFWGSFDLAMSRYSGRRAPPRRGADFITRDAYSHEVMSVGFWPGGGAVREPMYYAYIAPEPDGYAGTKLPAEVAYYDPTLREFVLPYEAVRTSGDPAGLLRRFCDSAYAAAATLAHWDRAALERSSTQE